MPAGNEYSRPALHAILVKYGSENSQTGRLSACVQVDRLKERGFIMLRDPFLNYFALGLLIFVIVVLFYGIIAIHDVPYLIAKKRNHPHQDAIHAAGWVSLFTLHVSWPFLWIWAMTYRPERGWGFHPIPLSQQPTSTSWRTFVVGLNIWKRDWESLPTIG